MTTAVRVPRIGYVVKRFPRLSETFILNELLALERRGLALEVFSLKTPREEPRHALLGALRAPVTYLADPEGPDSVKAAALAALASRRAVTHLHAHFGTSATAVARLASRLSGIGYSFTAHAKDIFQEDVDHTVLAEKIREARFVVTVSEYNRRYLRERFGAHLADRVVRVYNGLDLGRFAPDPAVPRAPDLILGVGRLVEKKGFSHLLEACAILRRRGLSFRCLVVGEGPERSALERRILALGLGDTVTLAGAQPQEHLLETMRRATVLALPCVVSGSGDRDGLPTVLLEALALGLPAVSTSLPGIEEIIEHRRTGLLAAPGDAVTLADALAELLASAALRERLATLGRDKAVRSFDVDRASQTLVHLFAGASGWPGRTAPREDPLPVAGPGGNDA